jgi:hypothetical protein
MQQPLRSPPHQRARLVFGVGALWPQRELPHVAHILGSIRDAGVVAQLRQQQVAVQQQVAHQPRKAHRQRGRVAAPAQVWARDAVRARRQ